LAAAETQAVGNPLVVAARGVDFRRDGPLRRDGVVGNTAPPRAVVVGKTFFLVGRAVGVEADEDESAFLTGRDVVVAIFRSGRWARGLVVGVDDDDVLLVLEGRDLGDLVLLLLVVDDAGLMPLKLDLLLDGAFVVVVVVDDAGLMPLRLARRLEGALVVAAAAAAVVVVVVVLAAGAAALEVLVVAVFDLVVVFLGSAVVVVVVFFLLDFGLLLVE